MMTEPLLTQAWRYAAALLALGAAAAWRWATPAVSVGILIGGAWNLSSLWCLGQLLGAWLGPTPSQRRAVGWLLVKFPALYLLAFGYLSRPAASVVGFGIGFTVVLAVATGWCVLRAQRLVPVRPHGR